MEYVVCTVLAVRAFIGADAGLGRGGWQVLVTHFTVRSEFKHVRTVPQYLFDDGTPL